MKTGRCKEEDYMENSKEIIRELIERKKELFIKVSDEIWANPELGFKEYQSSKILMEALEKEGFSVQKGIAGIPTAFKAVWGTGSPVIGFLGEYDALASMSQMAGISEKVPVKDGAPGHGCGHNLLGAGSLAAAVAAKDFLVENGKEGTIVYFGCPAEEAGCGKTFMAREGVFDCLDVALTWHPNTCNAIWSASSLSEVDVLFKFKGRTAHAAACPHLGRSALDAAELMNIGVNFLREHVIDQARIHYAFLNTGGTAPNVVQDSATLYYYIRAPKKSQVDEIFPRVIKVAQGAAMMTETTVSIEIESGISNFIPNNTLSEVMGECNVEMGGISFSEEAKQFAEEIYETISAEDKAVIAETFSAVTGIEDAGELANVKLLGEAFPYKENNYCMQGSTDVGDVSYVVPTAQMVAATAVQGTPGHSWQQTSQSCSPIAHEGLIYAGKVMAYTAAKLIENPELLKKAKEEHKKAVQGGYVCPIPAEVKPVLDKN